MLKKVLMFLGLAIVGLLAIVLVKTAMFSSKQVQVKPVKVSVDAQTVAKRLAESIRFRTISFEDSKQFKGKPFLDLIQFIEKSFPLVHKHLKVEKINKYSLLYTWKGSDPSLKPFLLMGHTDVVPVATGTLKDWKHPPYSGKIVDGAIWGRGSLDDKVAVIGVLEGVEALLAQKFKPKRTLYLAFGHDEEIGGNYGHKAIGARLKKRGVTLEYVLDEGMLITDGILPGVKQPVALVGLAEKGYVTIKLSIKGKGGHSSMPPKHTSIGLLSTAVHRLERNPMPARIHGPTAKMFEYAGPEMSFGLKAVFANLWLFRPVVMGILKKKKSTHATIRTTTAVTMFNSGTKENVLPVHASVVINFRILPGDSIKSVVAHVKKVINNDNIKVSYANAKFFTEPSPVSSIDAKGFKVVQRSIREIFPSAIVAPNLVVGGTDSRHYISLCKNIYRFVPIKMKPSDVKRIHGTNERIMVDNYADIVRFYQQLIRNSQH
ncbi:MAG: M20 family peptidase [Deltaproteobacteria bacterium]|nr:MAG: M20 family peptidase [Deltaproteobacteria bacterium]